MKHKAVNKILQQHFLKEFKAGESELKQKKLPEKSFWPVMLPVPQMK